MGLPVTDLTDFTEASRITRLLMRQSFEPQPPNLTAENARLKSEVSHLEAALDDARADIESLRSLLGIVVDSRLGGKVTLTPDELRAHPHSSHYLGASAQTITGELLLTTRA